MKKLIFLLLAVVLLLSSCNTSESHALPSLSADTIEELEISNTPDENSELIDSLIDIMQLDKTENSVAGFTGESTFGDVLDKKGKDRIKTVFLTYYSELAGYPAVTRYVFKNTHDGNASKDDGNPPLCLITIDIFQDKDGPRDEQLKEIISSMDAVLGEHSTDGESEITSWENESHRIDLSTNASSLKPETIAQISAFASPGVDLSGLFPYAFGTDIFTVYQNETPAPLPESFTVEPYSNFLSYEDGNTYVSFFFTVRDSELKLNGAGFQTDLEETGFEEIDKRLESFGDRMEDVLGPADSRGSIPYNKQPSLLVEWPGVEVKAYDYISIETYSIFINFSEEYFTG